MSTTATRFDQALAFVLDHEGRVCEDVPGDPGGKTKWGVTQDDYADYRRQHGKEIADVFQASEAELTQLYQEHYWIPVKGDSLDYPVALALFDSAVNVGLSRTLGWLRAVLGIKPSDPWYGAAEHYCEMHGATALATALIMRRNQYYNSIGATGKPLHKFLNGWLARTSDLLEAIL